MVLCNILHHHPTGISAACTAVAGIPRYGLDGLPTGQVSECDAQNAERWLAVRENRS
nr:hypothetical protein [Escherichia coli]